MDGTENYLSEKERVYWNSSTRETYIVMEDLSPAPEGLSYQLWAIVDGKPLDMGVVDTKDRIIASTAIAEADAFAITLEKEGESHTKSGTIGGNRKCDKSLT